MSISGYFVLVPDGNFDAPDLASAIRTALSAGDPQQTLEFATSTDEIYQLHYAISGRSVFGDRALGSLSEFLVFGGQMIENAAVGDEDPRGFRHAQLPLILDIIDEIDREVIVERLADPRALPRRGPIRLVGAPPPPPPAQPTAEQSVQQQRYLLEMFDRAVSFLRAAAANGSALLVCIV